MAVKSSGALSFATDIVGEFSDSTPHSLSEFYKGGGKVPDAAGNGNVPTSGAISMGNFYGAVNRIPISLTISSNTNNYNILSSVGGSYGAGASDVTLTINSGVTVGSTSTGTYALDTGTGWVSGDTITIVNNGTVRGRGGDGGDGGSSTNNSSGAKVSMSAGTAGGSGGNAFRAQFATAITNNGTFAGGGGGGGGGGSNRYFQSGNKGGMSTNGGGGGGGGAGLGSGGAGGYAGNFAKIFSNPTVSTNGTAASGSSGTATAGGAGAAGISIYGQNNNDTKGGDGGGLGSAGSSGTTAISTENKAAGAGGAAGNYAVGNSNITWSTTGTRLGGVS